MKNTDKRKWIIYLVLIVIWVLDLLLNRSNLFNYIISLLMILVFVRPHRFTFFEILVLFIVLFNTPAMDTFAELKRDNLEYNYMQNKQTLDIFLSPNTGQQEVLPAEVLQMLSMIRAHHIENYKLINSLSENELLIQRITESAWPIKNGANSVNEFCLIKDMKNVHNLSVVDKREDVALVHKR
jgi:hypothetical protein